MEGMIGEPVEPSPSYRPCPRALLGRPLAFPFSQSEAALFLSPMAYAMAWDLWLRPIIVILLIMKTRHCISG